MTEPMNIKSFFYGKNFSLEGRLFYPKILAPEQKTPQDRLKYSAMFAWNMNSNPAVTQALGAFVQEAKQAFFASIPSEFFVNPIKKYGTYQRMDGKPVSEFLKDCYWINASSGADFPPVVVDSSRQPIIDPALIYSGMNAVVNVSFYAITGEKKGLSTNIQAVMAMPGGDKEGGAGSVDVNSIFGDFASDMGMPPQQNASQAMNMPAQQQAPAPTQAPAPAQTWPPQDNSGGNTFI